MIVFENQSTNGDSAQYTHSGGTRDVQIHMSGSFGGGTLTPKVAHIEGETVLPLVPLLNIGYTEPDVVYLRLAAESRLVLELTGASGADLTVSVKPTQENR